MTAEQLVVLGLLAAAFSAGWIARGAGSRRREAVAAAKPSVAEFDQALEGTLTACRAALRDGPPREAKRLDVPRLMEELTAMEARLSEALGPDHPLTQDAADAVQALGLLADALTEQAAGREPAAEERRLVHDMVRAATTLRGRFRQGMAVLLAPLDDER